MAMDSFYGGRQGASFVIVYRFDAIDTSKSGEQYRCKEAAVSNTNPDLFLWENNNFVFKDGANYNNYTWKYLSLDGQNVETTAGPQPTTQKPAEGMVQYFSQGGATVDKVNYGEYVIIDSPYKSNPDNGKVFRRGMNFTLDPVNNPLAGAEYIGQIVGPKGDTPQIDLAHFNNFVDGDGHISGSFTPDGNDITPGYYIDGDGVKHYEESIDYKYAAVKDEYGNIHGVMVGFKIPTLIEDYTARSISPYENRKIDPNTGKYYNDNLINPDLDYYQRNPDTGEWEWRYPFYQKWRIDIPEGIHGIDSTNIEIIPTRTRPADEKTNYRGAQVWLDETCNEIYPSGGPQLYLSDYSFNIDLDHPVLPPDFAVGKTGDINWVRLNYQGDIVYIKKEDCYYDIIRYKETDYYNSEDGEETFYNIGDYKTIEKTYLSEDGHLTVYYTSKEEQETLDTLLRWIHYDPSNPNVSGITIDKEGTVKVYYNTFSINPITGERTRDVQEFKNIAGWIDDVKLYDDGSLVFEYNNGSDSINFEKAIKWIYKGKNEQDSPGISIQTEDETGIEGSGDQYIHVIYNIDDNKTVNDRNRIGKPLNYIIDAVISQGSAYAGAPHSHLLVYYSDPKVREERGTVHYKSPKLGNRDLEGWVDLGNVKGEAGGIHIIKEVISLEELQEDGQWIPPEDLDPDLGFDCAGWACSLAYYEYVSTTSADVEALKIVANDKDPILANEIRKVDVDKVTSGFNIGDYVKRYELADTEILFYDYETKTWNSIGSLNSSSIDPSYIIDKSKPVDDNMLPPAAIQSKIKVGGFWFGTEDVTTIY